MIESDTVNESEWLSDTVTESEWLNQIQWLRASDYKWCSEWLSDTATESEWLSDTVIESEWLSQIQSQWPLPLPLPPPPSPPPSPSPSLSISPPPPPLPLPHFPPPPPLRPRGQCRHIPGFIFQIVAGYLSVLNTSYPQYVEEMEGMAQGSGVNFSTVGRYPLILWWRQDMDTLSTLLGVRGIHRSPEVLQHNSVMWSFDVTLYR